MSSLDKIPEADMAAIAPRSQIERRAFLGFVPRIGLRIVDYADVERIDTFYMQCQDYRDYYRDPYDRLHKPPKFRQHLGKCGVKLDNSVDVLRQPIRWVQKRVPLIDAIEYKSHMNLGVETSRIFAGRYSKNTCISFKR